MRLRQQHWNTVDETESSNITYSVQGFVTAENFAHTCDMRCMYWFLEGNVSPFTSKGSTYAVCCSVIRNVINLLNRNIKPVCVFSNLAAESNQCGSSLNPDN